MHFPDVCQKQDCFQYTTPERTAQEQRQMKYFSQE